uniref:Uncharacterized protein n=1 Tax=Arundo donax TaxID=35708 RepID=A0A0A9EV94_ARUDO
MRIKIASEIQSKKEQCSTGNTRIMRDFSQG